MSILNFVYFSLLIIPALNLYYFVLHRPNIKKQEALKIIEKTTEENKRKIIPLKRALIRNNAAHLKRIQNEPPSKTADEIMAEMRARHQAIMTGDYSKIKPSVIMISY